jgi:SpoIIAA-like
MAPEAPCVFADLARLTLRASGSHCTRIGGSLAALAGMSMRPQRTDFEYVPPRLVSIRFHGTLDEEEARAVMDAIESQVATEPYLLLEADMSAIEGATPEARKIAADRLDRLPSRAIAVVGGSFAQRIIAKLVLTAVSMLGRKGRNEVRFFSDRESARTWLYEYGTQQEALQVNKNNK